MLRVIKIGVVLWLLVVMLALGGCLGGNAVGQIPVPGKPAPDFQLESLRGQAISLSELRGRPVLLNFWAIWCGPCRLEMPFLQEVYKDGEWEKRGLVILAVNLGEPAEVVREFMETNGFSFTVLLDTEGKAGMLYNAAAIPTTYFIDNDGIIRNKKTGAFTRKSDIDQALLNMLMKAEQ